MVLFKTVIEVGKVPFRYGKSVGKFTSGETSFIRRFPPNYREPVKTIIKGSNIVIHGGLVADILKGWDNDDIEDAPFQKQREFPKTRKYNKTRNRYSRRFNPCRPRYPYNRRRT